MRQAIRTKSPRAQVSEVYSQAAPVGGWNARDSWASMAPSDAITLTNWFPRTTDCVMRGGSAAYADTITGTVKTLAVYNKMDGTSEMFAVDENDVWDVSSSGAASAQSVTVTNGKFQHLNFGDGTNNWLILVNGVDKALYYDGTTWTSVDSGTSPALSGLTSTSIVHVCEYKGRLIFLEINSLSFWYLAAGAAGGALTEFDLSSLCSHGGYLMWAATWSFDAGDGPDDAIVFMTSEGEVIVYRGTDPSTAANWVLAGVYFIGKPLGRRSFTKYAGDLLALTQNGVFPLSTALQSSTVDNRVAITNKIEGAFNTQALDHGSTFGWEAILYPAQSALIFNIPQSEGGVHYQYVMNTITKAWCSFDSWDGECFAEFNKELYYGLSTAVYKCWSGYSDVGGDIVAVGKTAFNYFGNTSQQKRVNMFRPMLRANGSMSFKAGMDIDFSDNDITGTATYVAQTGSVWDTAVWDTGVWKGQLDTIRQWTSPRPNVGYAISGGIKVSNNSLEVHWVANDFVYERGGVL